MRITSAKFVKGIIGTDDILYDGIPQIAFVGRSNVGKSSVINSLTNHKDLVKVGKKPGKTKEINFFLINSAKGGSLSAGRQAPDGNKFYFVDLPGYGYARLSPDEKEKISKRMIWYLMESGVKLEYVVLVLDIKVGFTDFDKEMAQLLRDEGHPFIIIANKTDKLNQKEISQQLALIRKDSRGEEVIPFSATEKEGVDLVISRLMDPYTQ